MRNGAEEIRKKRAQEDARPYLIPEDHDRGHPQPGREPNGRDICIRIWDRKPQLAGCEIAETHRTKF